MAKRLTKLRVDEVSAVDKAANGKRFLIFKRHIEEPEPVEKTIRKDGEKWAIYSEDGSKRLGEYDSEEAAKKRLGQIEWFKAHKRLQADAQDNGGSDEMTPDQVQKAIEAGIAAAMEPVVKKLEELEAELLPKTTPVEKSEDGGEDGEALTLETITKAVQEVVAEAVAPLEKRLGEVEEAAGERQSGSPEVIGAVKKSAGENGFWAGTGLF